mmetsp:Transcript_15114/g.26823  ORF Transcript_15114/g.26823 Transcript_15114/m.26823 type:complete len:545 (+) Transcript_15114:98-1732(+)|eukprot:CAMPEP_0175069224 /NCGR_PEP_ID=MMETSP0052_2-20121109/18084_1 /TAXON_ID=51329 ORGANISM="Polytomella parva, Strain SAG 63-3" /NCGR_SAMPLE_ID=MMETSP0052_2 /ASSEMBLY_ACC=CAM_ASM_000194 /LENGTH=544 /DNA_ID=CAMNT_0016336291 /DNA_START=25 /DNA_END=1659 /DNA_ORIENTATION=-
MNQLSHDLGRSSFNSSFVSRRHTASYCPHTTIQSQLKGEDIITVENLKIQCETPATCYIVCDGHSGVGAAKFVSQNLARILNSKLPTHAPNLAIKTELDSFASTIRRIICETFIALDNQWLNDSPNNSGTTLSLAVRIGPLLSVAAVGDSIVVLDTGCSILEMIDSHRLQVNKREQERLRLAGCFVAPLGFHLEGPARPNELSVGPLRMWPGGLCVSRTIGDIDAGNFIIPMPHIRQVVLPPAGARLILASDGLWDLVSISRAAKLIRNHPIESAANHLVETALRDNKQLDDCSVIVADFLPKRGTNFPTVALKAGRSITNANGKSSGGVGFFSCFKTKEVDEPDSRHVEGFGHLPFLSDLDTLEILPELKQTLNRMAVVVPAPYTTVPEDAAKAAAKSGKDLTMHRADKVSVYKGFLSTLYGSSGSLASNNAVGSPGGTNHTVNSSVPSVATIDEDGEASNHSCPTTTTSSATALAAHVQGGGVAKDINDGIKGLEGEGGENGDGKGSGMKGRGVPSHKHETVHGGGGVAARALASSIRVSAK